MIPGRASAAFIPNFPSSDAKALSFDLTHSYRSFSSLGGGPPDVAAAPPPPGNNASTSTSEYGSNSNSLLSKQSSDLVT